MSSPIIRVENLGKRYIIGHQRSSYEGFRHVVEGAIRSPLKWLRSRAEDRAQQREEFWALQDVSVEVKQGEVVGVIGRNGAGKSTLLKILSRITEPTKGRIEIEGRVASLLEVGTGFHPELTGRENVFLNGAILGMSRLEIKSKFDEIIAFAEIEKFLDTPVKRYSSGMYVRLAFAVAAHLEPEILVIDEVLAVGDAQFQKKCLGKMEEVAQQHGRTVLFVSHNLAAVRALCQTGIYLERGRLAYHGPVATALDRYLRGNGSEMLTGILSDSHPRLYSTGDAKVRRAQIIDSEDQPLLAVTTGDSIDILVEYEVIKPLNAAFLEIGIMDFEGRQITQSLSWDGGRHLLKMLPGRYEARLHIDAVFFPGRYSLLTAIHKEDGATVEFVERALDFEILNSAKDDPNHQRWNIRGYFRPDERWDGPFLIDPVATLHHDRK